MSKPKNLRRYWAAAIACFGLTVIANAGEPIQDPAAPSPHEDDPKLTNLAVDALVDADINWRGSSGFSASWAFPELDGANARYVAWQGRRKVPELLGVLDKPGSTVAAHVLLTQLWTPDHEKEHRSEPIKRGRFVGGGYLIHYNGLELRLLWLEQGKEFYQRVVIHDREEQLKKIREFWKTRYRDFPEEFSTRKVAK